MTYKNKVKYDEELNENLRVDCEKCFGFCCVALYFSASEGFPTNKDAGKPCINLQPDFKCTVHKSLRDKGLKGCMAYDCFGSGQKVAQVTYGGKDWRGNPEISKEMFEIFLIMRQLHEMLWYLKEALSIPQDNLVQNKIINIIDETIRLTDLDPDSLIKLDLVAHRNNVNLLLAMTSEAVRSKERRGKKSNLNRKKIIAGRLNLIGLNLKKVNLRGEDLRGALLIATDLRDVDLSGADLIGADMRDTDIRGANLSRSIFITQAQINGAKGDSNTRLPISIVRPSHWDK
ncbi:pentapeptide repeat-containing protein [Clostridium sp. LP20]|uniref:pentapeptide repeat-containing protein n=1 Tax=Clostridium sp. LP20 TaxID=3418665 RepID=UPI003EE46536